MEKEKKYYTQELVDSAIEELEERLKEEEIKTDESYAIEIDDLIAEIADSHIPIYTYDLLQYASNNFDLIQTNDLCLNSSYGDITQIIQANIYELLMEDLYDYLEEKFQQERKVGWIEAINSGLKPSESPEITKRTKGE